VPVALRNLAPKPSTGPRASVSDDEGNDLTSAPAQSNPEPPLVCFLAYEAPGLVQFQDVTFLGLTGGLLQVVGLASLFLSHFESVLRLTPKMRSMARIEPRS